MIIFFVYPLFIPNIGGTEVPMYQLASELNKRGRKVIVFTTNAYGLKPSTLKEFENVGGVIIKRFRYYPMKFYNMFFFSPQFALTFFKEVKVADIIYIFSWQPSFFIITSYLIAKIRKVPIVFYPQCNPYRSHYYPTITKRMIGLFLDKVIGPYVFKSVDHVIALTKEELEFYRKKGVKRVTLFREPIFVIDAMSNDILMFKEKFKLHNVRYVLLTVCRLTKHKGLETLIACLPKILESFHDLKLLIVGEDWGALHNCVMLARKLHCDQNIIFTGRLDDKELACAYEVADIVILPSYFEAYGRIVVEAFSHHKPVIVTSMVGLAEVVRRGCGFVVKPGDINELSKAIITLLEKPKVRKSMGEIGYTIFKNEFALDFAVSKLECIHQSISKLYACKKKVNKAFVSY